MRIVMILAVAGVLVNARGAGAAGDRVLFDNDDFDVTAPAGIDCSGSVALLVRSSSPELFEAGSAELQRLVDASQAVLGFECPGVPALEVEGRLTGLDEPVYTGRAERASNWQLVARRSIQSEQYQEYAAARDEAYGSAAGVGGHEFAVANLSVGMTVDEARSSVQETFGVEAAYDVDEGVLTMRSGGCPADYDWAALSPRPEPHWKCLQARFTDQRVARMYLVDLVQVIEHDDPEAVQRHLIERFGQPVYQGEVERDRSWWQRKSAVHVMGWGDVIESNGAGEGNPKTDVYTLQAKVLPLDDVVIVTVTLYQPGLRPGRSPAADRKNSDLTL